MKKADRKKLDAALDKALSPPRKIQRQALDALLEEYDHGAQADAPDLGLIVSAPPPPTTSYHLPPPKTWYPPPPKTW